MKQNDIKWQSMENYGSFNETLEALTMKRAKKNQLLRIQNWATQNNQDSARLKIVMELHFRPLFQ